MYIARNKVVSSSKFRENLQEIVCYKREEKINSSHKSETRSGEWNGQMSLDTSQCIPGL